MVRPPKDSRTLSSLLRSTVLDVSQAFTIKAGPQSDSFSKLSSSLTAYRVHRSLPPQILQTCSVLLLSSLSFPPPLPWPTPSRSTPPAARCNWRGGLTTLASLSLTSGCRHLLLPPHYTFHHIVDSGACGIVSQPSDFVRTLG
jgi:hypothetical protein